MAAPKVKLAVMKAPGHVPGGGYHYMLYPAAQDDDHASMFSLMGYTIIEASQADATRLIAASAAALKHQCEVAVLTEGALKK
jgi:vacuolar-type H+-ATPase subunit F/Vma7